jgi:flavin-dependent dehydrogenase
MNFDVIVIGAGIAGSSFARKISPHAKTLLLEENEDVTVRTNVFPEHNMPYIDVDDTNKEIFPHDHVKTNYMGKEKDGFIDSTEFGAPLGKISHTENLIKYLLEKCEENEGIVKFNKKLTNVNRHSDYIEVRTNDGDEFKAKVLVLATGSRALELQNSLGFETPDSYMGIYTHLYGTEDQIKENFNFQYLFHLNGNISENGPFFFNVGRDRVIAGFLGNKDETEVQIKNKLDRILKNYQYIQPYIKGLKREEKPFFTGKISKHPIKKMSQDRILVLGEAAGLVTAFFYEGLLSGLVSAQSAVDTLQPLLEKGSNFTRQELRDYDRKIDHILSDYYRNGAACESLFYNAGSSTKLLWNTYIDLINDNKKLRRQIWEAYRIPDVSQYDISRDRWAGEQLFSKLPTLSKITLGPRFFKAMMKN